MSDAAVVAVVIGSLLGGSPPLAQVGAAKNPRHVVIIGLESFRADVIEAGLTPHLARLAGESLRYQEARAEAIYTAMAWHRLLRDRPTQALWSDLGAKRGLTSWPLAVMKAAGYTVRLAVSGDLSSGAIPESKDPLCQKDPAIDEQVEAVQVKVDDHH